MKKSHIAFLLVGFGFLPLWISIALLMVGSLKQSNSSDYWTVAPWMVIAGIVYCQYTLGIAVATIAVSVMVKGTPERRRKLAGATFVTLVLGAGAVLAYGKMQRDSHAADLKAEEARVFEFVKHSPTVRQAMGSEFDVRNTGTTIDRSGWPVMYDIAVSPMIKDFKVKMERTQYVIVDISRTDTSPTFSVRCLTPIYSGQRQVGTDPCQR